MRTHEECSYDPDGYCLYHDCCKHFSIELERLRRQNKQYRDERDALIAQEIVDRNGTYDIPPMWPID